MKIQAYRNETFIYLNGIKPSKEIILADGLSFQPCSCNPAPDDIISRSKSEIDIGVACLFLRSVSSQFKITAKDSKTLAILSWNSAWDAFALGALFDCEVGFNFQSDVSADDYSKSKEFSVINYALKGLQRNKYRKITPAEERWLNLHYSKFRKLMELDRFQNAVHCLATYRWHSMPRVQLAILWAGIEGIFEVDYELSFRLSIYIARFLAPKSKSRRNAIFNKVKKLYSIRSKAVHGSKLKDSKDGLADSIYFLREILKKSAEIGTLPSQNELVP